MRALGIALIVIGLALVCGGLIFQRRFLEPDEESSQEGRSGEIPQSLDPVERRLLEDDPAYAETPRRLNAMDPKMRNEGGEDHGPNGETDRSVPLR